MAQSRLIELSYFDPHTSIRLTTYADTIVTDYSSPNRIISAVRFGGYPEVVKARLRPVRRIYFSLWRSILPGPTSKTPMVTR